MRYDFTWHKWIWTIQDHIIRDALVVAVIAGLLWLYSRGYRLSVTEVPNAKRDAKRAARRAQEEETYLREQAYRMTAYGRRPLRADEPADSEAPLMEKIERDQAAAQARGESAVSARHDQHRQQPATPSISARRGVAGLPTTRRPNHRSDRQPDA